MRKKTIESFGTKPKGTNQVTGTTLLSWINIKWDY